MMDQRDLEMIAEITTQAMQPVLQRLDKMDVRFDKIESRLDKMEGRFGEIESRLDKVDGRLDKMDDRFGEIESRLDKMESRLGSLEAGQAEMKSEIDKLARKVMEVQLTLQNETNKKISIIADGHLDLSRKLDKALQVENEKEILLLRVTALENEIRRLKDRIEEIA